MCDYCKSVIKAIDAYIEKADDDLEELFEEEGRVLPKETVKSINTFEKAVADSLFKQTQYFAKEIKKGSTLSEFMGIIEEIKAKDAYSKEVRDALFEQLHEIIPKYTKVYISDVDSKLPFNNLSNRTTSMIDNWSVEFGKLTQVTGHNEIEKIVSNGIANGDSVAEVTRKLLDEGVRDEYYKSRRIAVTEMLRAHDIAQQEAFMQNPSVTQKRWRHTGSHKNEPRPNHVNMDGQVVGVEEPYELIGADGNTYYPMYPCDVSLPPGESINCHCISQPIVSEEILGLSLEERERLQQEAIDEMDDEWEKELNERNKAKAGIEV